MYVCECVLSRKDYNNFDFMSRLARFSGFLLNDSYLEFQMFT